MSDDGGEDDHDDAVHDRHGQALLSAEKELKSEGIELDAFPVPENSFGDAVMSLVMAADTRSGYMKGSHRQLWICSSFFLYFVGIAGQFLLSYALFATSIERNEAHYENGRAEDMTDKLSTAVRVGAPLLEEGVTYLCDRTDVTVIPAYFVMLCIWFLRMLDEFAQDLWLVIVTQRVLLYPDFGNDSDSSSESSGSQEPLIHTSSIGGVKCYQIRHLTPRLKWESFLIALPRLVTVVWITWVGAKFLIFAHQTKDLILKTLVCSFFVQVEHLVFHSLVSDAKKRRMQHTTILFLPLKSEDWSNYGSTVVRISLMVLFVSATWFGIFGHIRAFRYACLAYEQAFPKGIRVVNGSTPCLPI